MTPGVSVIICCYNSAARLPATIQHLLDQTDTGAIDWEVIVVDNASTDNTYDLALKLLSAGKIHYKVVKEPVPGLAMARVKGLQTSKYEYLLYCDDDNHLAANYVSLSFDIMQKNPLIGILGGVGEAVFESNEPFWFKQYCHSFAVGDQSDSPNDLSKVEEVYGAGCVIRKTFMNLLGASGFKLMLMGRTATAVISGDDSELCLMAHFFGYEVWFHRGLRFGHLMSEGRMNWKYMKRLYHGFGRSQAYIKVYKHIQEGKQIHNKNLRLPFWLDTFIHKAKYIVAFYPKVFGKMNEEGNPDVLRFHAMLGEASEIWKLKQKYSDLFDTVLANQNAGHK